MPTIKPVNTMNVETIRRYCLSFPRTQEKLQWGETLCFKVEGKIFTLVSLDAVPPSLCLKAAPDKFAELLEIEGITPAPYVGRYKWVLLERLDLLPPTELQELIAQSYEMVTAKLSKSSKRKKTRARQRKPAR